MDIQVKYIETQTNPDVKRRGGVLLKGLSRSERQPVHLYFLIDTSGSMHIDEKLGNVKRSMNFILPLLTPQDQISLGSFSTDSKSHLVRNPVTNENKQAIEYQISQMKADGNTNLSAGLLMASSVFQEVPTDSVQRKQGLIILTDGHANVGVVKEEPILEIVRHMLTKLPSLSITTVGYGEDHNADLLSKMSIQGSGSYNIVKNLEDVASVFGEILGGLLSVSAQMIDVYLPPETECDTIYPTQTLEGGVIKVRIGDLYSEAVQTLMFRSAPSQGPIRITGVLLPSLENLDRQIQPELLQDGEQPDETLQLAHYRAEVTKILKEARSSYSPAVIQKAKDFLLVLENSPYKENLLVKMMMDDLKFIADKENMIHDHLHNPTTVLAQHETYLAVGKGLRSPTNYHYTNAAAAPEAQTSVFSNNVQRTLTSQLRTASSRH